MYLWNTFFAFVQNGHVDLENTITFFPAILESTSSWTLGMVLLLVLNFQREKRCEPITAKRLVGDSLNGSYTGSLSRKGTRLVLGSSLLHMQ